MPSGRDVRSAAIVFLLLSPVLHPVVGQDGNQPAHLSEPAEWKLEIGRQVVVVSKKGDELRRLAHRFNTSPQQIRNARRLLYTATEIVLDEESGRLVGSAQRIGRYWAYLDRGMAPQEIERIIMSLKDRALEAADVDSYRSAVRAGLSLSAQLAFFDDDRALKALRGFGRTPRSLGGEGEELARQFRESLREEEFTREYEEDPPAALRKLVQEQRSPGPRVPWNKLYEERDPSKFDDLVEGVLAKFQQSGSQSSLSQLQNLVRLAAERDSVHLESIVDLVLEGSTSSKPEYGTSIFEMNGESFEVESLDRRLLQTLRNLRNHPQLLLELVQSRPELQSTADRFGGLDRAMSARHVGYRSPDGQTNRFGGRPPEIKQERLRANVIRRPGWVRQRLLEISREDEGFEGLIQIANNSTEGVPELAEMSLKLARSLTDSEENPGQRLIRQYLLIAATRAFEGEVPKEMLDQGFALLAELKEDETPLELSKQTPIMVPAGRRSTRSISVEDKDKLLGNLEKGLVLERARQDFDDAFAYMQSKTDTKVKVALMLATLRGLTRDNR